MTMARLKWDPRVESAAGALVASLEAELGSVERKRLTAVPRFTNSAGPRRVLLALDFARKAAEGFAHALEGGAELAKSLADAFRGAVGQGFSWRVGGKVEHAPPLVITVGEQRDAARFVFDYRMTAGEVRDAVAALVPALERSAQGPRVQAPGSYFFVPDAQAWVLVDQAFVESEIAKKKAAARASKKLTLVFPRFSCTPKVREEMSKRLDVNHLGKIVDHERKGDDVILTVTDVTEEDLRRALELREVWFAFASLQVPEVVELWNARGECLYEALPDVESRPLSCEDVTTKELRRELGRVGLVVLTVTATERAALRTHMKALPGRERLLIGSVEKLTVCVGRLGQHRIAHIECTMGSGGSAGSTLVTDDAIRVLRPKAVLAVGIAFGSDKAKQRLGDVLIASTIAPYELAKKSKDGIDRRGSPLDADPDLLNVFATRTSEWVHHRRGGLTVKQHPGLVLSGEKVINDQEFLEALQEDYPTAIGGEMEGSGVYAAGKRRRCSVVLVKAICDWADGHKNDRAQAFAAHAAVDLVAHVLAKPDVLSAIGIPSIPLPRSRKKASAKRAAKGAAKRGAPSSR